MHTEKPLGRFLHDLAQALMMQNNPPVVADQFGVIPGGFHVKHIASRQAFRTAGVFDIEVFRGRFAVRLTVNGFTAT